MSRTVRYIALLITWFLVAPAYAVIEVNSLDAPLSIAGEWRFQSGDDLQWAAPGLDDSAWLIATVPAHSPPAPVDANGMGWYRLTLQLDPDSDSVSRHMGALAVSLSKVMSAYELYAGGVMIGGAGKLPPEQSAEYDRHKTLDIPASAVDDNGRLVLALRLWRDPAVAAHWETGPHAGRFLVGNVGDLRSSAVMHALVPSVILAALYFVLGWYHLIIARRNPVLREFFWFGCLSIALGVYTLEVNQGRFLLDIPYWLHKKIELLCLYLLPILLTQTLFLATRTPLNRLFRLFYVVFLLMFAAVALVPNEQINLQTLKPFQYVGAAWSICLAGIISFRAWQGVRSARLVFVLLLLLVGAVFNDVIATSPWIESRQTLQFVGAFLLIFIALLMAERYTDILKRLETSVEERTAELVASNRELEDALETKGNFLATISHEMRTPMNAILGLTHLGLKTQLSEQQRDYFTKVEKSATGLQAIIDNILDFTRIEQGALECVSEPFTPQGLVDDVARDWGSATEEAGLVLDLDVGANLPEALSGDEARLRQVLGIFVSNAIKFTSQGSVGVSMTLRSQQQDRARIRFAVADTGVGISSRQREHLFEAFSQADNSMTRDFGGTGLGLAIARRLVAEMGGEISLDSVPDEGSVFSFELDLPVRDIGAVSEVAEVAEVDNEGQVVGEAIDLLPIRGARVLLVDDSEINLQVASELLLQANLSVDMALDGKEAVDKVLGGDYECVLMDVQMPVMDGYTATETIRADARYVQLPILAMTANAMAQDRERGTQAGMNAYIPKPIDPDELYRSLLKWIAPGEREYVPPVIEAVNSASAEVAGLPDALPGLWISEGLKRVGGNTDLYLKLLKDMCKSYADAATEMQTLLDSNDLEQAAQFAHKVRGIANNLGAADVGGIAESIELALKSGQSIDANTLQTLSDAMSVVTESQASLSPLITIETTQAEATLGRGELELAFKELSTAVADNNPEALDIAQRMLDGVGEGGAGFEQLHAALAALDMFDFAGAQEHLQKAAEALGLS